MGKAGLLAQGLGRQLQLFFRMALKGRVVLRHTSHPLALHVGVGDPHVEGIIAHGHLRPLDFWMAQGIMPVEEIVQLHPVAGHHLRCRVARAGAGRHQEILIVEDATMRPLPAESQAGHIGIAR